MMLFHTGASHHQNENSSVLSPKNFAMTHLSGLQYLRDVLQSAVNHMRVLNTANVDSWV
jgi:hypothetical protein